MTHNRDLPEVSKTLKKRFFVNSIKMLNLSPKELKAIAKMVLKAIKACLKMNY